jgi:hypothetical protein
MYDVRYVVCGLIDVRICNQHAWPTMRMHPLRGISQQKLMPTLEI